MLRRLHPRLRTVKVLHFVPLAEFSMWQKFIPRFLKKDKPAQDLVPAPSDEIRKKIFEAELQEIIELGKKPQEEWVAKQVKQERESKQQEQEINQGIAELRDEAVMELEHPPVYSIHEIMTSTKEHEDGTVELPLLIRDDKPMTFKTKQEYESWLADKQQDILTRTRSRLTSHEFYVTQGKYMERAFTGLYWWVKDAGTYSCKVCTQKLFMSEHKYELNNGYANFWSHVLDSVSYREDHLDRHTTASNQGFVEKKFREKLPEVRAVCSN